MTNQWQIKDKKLGARSWGVSTGIARKAGMRNVFRLGFQLGIFRIVLLAGHHER